MTVEWDASGRTRDAGPSGQKATNRRVAVVTGAARGIGAAIAQRLTTDGYHVVALDRDEAGAVATAAGATSSGGSAEGGGLDVTDRVAVATAFGELADRLGCIDAVVNNAMWISYRPLEEFDEDIVDGMLAIGVKAALWTMQAALPVMRKQGSGAIVNLTSPAAVRGVPGAAVYSAVKGAVTALTIQSAAELAPSGIRVNAVMPGAVPTPGATSVVDEAGYQRRLARIPLGRLGTAEDIAKGVSFLLSPDADYVTGHVLTVDGGFLTT